MTAPKIIPSHESVTPPVGGPVAWQRRGKVVKTWHQIPGDSTDPETLDAYRAAGYEVRPVYATPQPQEPACREAADVLERIAKENLSDPATDDLTVPLAIRLAEVETEATKWRKAYEEVRDLAKVAISSPENRTASAVGDGVRQPDGMKLVYIKRWRTLIYVSESYADKIRDAMNAAPSPSSIELDGGVREALEFYADPFAWKKKHDPEDVVRIPDFYSETSFGDTAAETLSALAAGTTARPSSAPGREEMVQSTTEQASSGLRSPTSRKG